MAMWACNTVIIGKPWPYTNTIPTWPAAFGIYPKPIQDSWLVWKNAGLFWGGGLDQVWFYPGGIGQTTAQAAEAFDEYWVTGPNAYPAGCDPTYPMYHSVQYLESAFPKLHEFKPVLEGFWWLVYSGVYDQELLNDNLNSIHQ